MIRLLIILGFWLGISATLAAQVMLRGGVNYSDIAIDNETTTEVFDRKPGYHVGLNANVPLGRLWALRPAVLYHLKGASYDDGATEEDTDLKYLEVPVNLGIALGPLVLEAGPYFGYLLDTTEGVFSEESFNKTDWGANFGAVIELDKIGFGVNYSNSLDNIADDNQVLGTATELTNGNLSIFAYYIF